MRRATGTGDGGGGNNGGDSCRSQPAKVNLAPRRRTPSWDSASLLLSLRSVKAAKEGDECDDGSILLPRQMNHPEMSKLSKRDVCKLFC